MGVGGVVPGRNGGIADRAAGERRRRHRGGPGRRRRGQRLHRPAGGRQHRAGHRPRQRRRRSALVLQLNSKRATVSCERMAALGTCSSPPRRFPLRSGSGRRARERRPSGQLLGVAPVTAMASGSRVGHFGVALDVPGLTLDGAAASDRPRAASAPRTAKVRGVSARRPPTRACRRWRTCCGPRRRPVQGRTVTTARAGVRRAGRAPAHRHGAPVQARSLPRLLHTVASPPVAYLLLTIGLALLVFELFTAGVGVAGVVGRRLHPARRLRRWPRCRRAVGRSARSCSPCVAFAVDVQTGVPRLLDRRGRRRCTSSASVFLYHGLSLSWITLLVGIGGSSLAFLAGMPSMVRTRFATPTIGREWMIGEAGEAVVAVNPEGVVLVRGAQWRARTNRATPIDGRCRGERRRHRGGHPRGRADRGRGPRLPRAGTRTPRVKGRAGRLVTVGGCRSQPSAVSSQVGLAWKGRPGVVYPARYGDLAVTSGLSGTGRAILFPPTRSERKDEKAEREERAKAICAECSVRDRLSRLRGAHPGAARDLGRPHRGGAAGTAPTPARLTTAFR